jgi:hypothetical protein
MTSRSRLASALLALTASAAIASPALAQQASAPGSAPAAPSADDAAAAPAAPADPAAAAAPPAEALAPPPVSAPPPPPQYRPAPPLPYLDVAPTEPADRRRGFMIGGFIGGGSMQPDCGSSESCDGLGGASLGGQLGGFVVPRFALLLDAWFLFSNEDNSVYRTSRGYLGVSAAYWLSPRFWIKGGFGSAKLAISDEDGDVLSRSESVLGLLLAAGVELMHRDKVSIDLAFRLGTESYPNDYGDDARLTTFSFDVALNVFQ